MLQAPHDSQSFLWKQSTDCKHRVPDTRNPGILCLQPAGAGVEGIFGPATQASEGPTPLRGEAFHLVQSSRSKPTAFQAVSFERGLITNNNGDGRVAAECGQPRGVEIAIWLVSQIHQVTS